MTTTLDRIPPSGQGGTQLVVTQRPSLAPRTIQEALDFSSYLAKSELIPKDYQNKPHNIFVAVQYGMELGLQPLQALQSIAVINGRPSMWGDAVLAVVIGHPMYEWHREVIEGEGDNRVGVFTIKRRNQEEHVTRFSVADARKAGLWGKAGPWTQYADRMLKLRARGFALRDKFPDALKGIISREEAEDYPTQEPRNVTPSSPQPEVIPPAKTAAPPKLITKEQAGAFSRAYRTSGYQVEEARAYIKDTFGLDSTLQMNVDQYQTAMRWAQVPKPTGEVAISEDEQACHTAFARLHLTPEQQAGMIAEYNGDWPALLGSLNSLLADAVRTQGSEQDGALFDGE